MRHEDVQGFSFLAEEHWVTEDGHPVAYGLSDVMAFGKRNGERCFVCMENPINYD